jgi:hypothetical protein
MKAVVAARTNAGSALSSVWRWLTGRLLLVAPYCVRFG